MALFCRQMILGIKTINQYLRMALTGRGHTPGGDNRKRPFHLGESLLPSRQQAAHPSIDAIRQGAGNFIAMGWVLAKSIFWSPGPRFLSNKHQALCCAQQAPVFCDKATMCRVNFCAASRPASVTTIGFSNHTRLAKLRAVTGCPDLSR